MTTQRLVTLLGKVTDIYHFASPLMLVPRRGGNSLPLPLPGLGGV